MRWYYPCHDYPPPPPNELKSRTRKIYAYDCLEALNDEVAFPSGSVDLIYLDPPFNSKSNYNLPFKGKDKKDAKPVEAFRDTWSWGVKQDEYLRELDRGPSTQRLADIVKLAQNIELRSSGASLPAYLVNMAMRLIPMKRVLKKTGSIYLHCDPTASHYLKLVLDAIFGVSNFRNEIIWGYHTGGVSKYWFPKKHDVIFCYGALPATMKKTTHNPPQERIYYDKPFMTTKKDDLGRYYADVYLRDVWDDQGVKPLLNLSRERLGYPTQKPLALLERIIKASSNRGDTVLDPFCGCGTTVCAAEILGRNWIGIDISTFSTGLIRERLSKYCNIPYTSIEMIGTPVDLSSAKALAEKDKFEFEKWVCGAIGAHGMFHNPGEKGRDGGVDGVIQFGLLKNLKKGLKKTYAIVQVKGGKVTVDSVKALYSTVERYGATAGVFVCFGEYMKTVENNRVKKNFEDLLGEYPVIQGFSIEQLLRNERPNLPPQFYNKEARLNNKLFSSDGLYR